MLEFSGDDWKPREWVVRQAKQDLEDTRNTLAADQKFLMNLKETCQMTDAESDERNEYS